MVSTIPLPRTTLSTVIRMHFEEIHINSYEICANFVRISGEQNCVNILKM